MNGPTHSSPGSESHDGRIESVGTLFAEAIHDVNNMLQVITGLAQTEAARSDNERATDALRQIDAAARLAGDLTRALLDIARSSECDEPGDVSEAVRCVLAMFTPRLTDRIGCQVSWVKGGPLPSVAISTADLAVVVSNVIKNAADALRGTRDPRLIVTTSVDGERVTVDIWNSGDAIPEEVIARVFDPFFSTKPAQMGTGLGLGICRRLLSSCGGDIRVENSRPRGVHVYVEVPAVRAQCVVNERPRAVSTSLRGHRVLLVDDDVAIRQVVGDIAAVLGGADVVTCESGEAALEMLGREDFDAVILDIRMPGISGIDVYRALSDSQKARIIFLTGDTANRGIRDFISSTHRPALYKPIGSSDVLDAVGRVVGTG